MPWLFSRIRGCPHLFSKGTLFIFFSQTTHAFQFQDMANHGNPGSKLTPPYEKRNGWELGTGLLGLFQTWPQLLQKLGPDLFGSIWINPEKCTAGGPPRCITDTENWGIGRSWTASIRGGPNFILISQI